MIILERPAEREVPECHWLRETMSRGLRMTTQQTVPITIAVAEVAAAERSLRAVIELIADALKAASDFQRAAKVSLDLAQQQMQTGNANILLLLTSQQSYLQATIQVVQARAARLSDTVALFQALGGGWWNREGLPDQRILNVGTGAADIAAERPGEVHSIGTDLSESSARTLRRDDDNVWEYIAILHSCFPAIATQIRLGTSARDHFMPCKSCPIAQSNASLPPRAAARGSS